MSHVSIKSDHVKDLTIKMATSTVVITHRSDNTLIHRRSTLQEYIVIVCSRDVTICFYLEYYYSRYVTQMADAETFLLSGLLNDFKTEPRPN